MSEELQSQERVEAIADLFRIPIPLSEIHGIGAFDESGTRGNNQPAYREPDAGDGFGGRSRHPFQVYMIGMESEFVALVRVAWGTVLNSEDDITDTIEIGGLTSDFSISFGNWIRLECDFNEDGELTSCSLVAGGTWDGYPACYSSGTGEGNRWFHPIAHVRTLQDGESPDIGVGVKIAQLTHTHLIKTRACVGDDSMTRLWKLIPGQGGAP